MKKPTARDFVKEALANGGAQEKGNTSSPQVQTDDTGKINADDISSVRFTMNPKSGLTVEITKRSGKKVQPQKLWIASPFEILGRVRDPNSEGPALD